MQFYQLDHYPRGNADTCYREEDGYNQGDATFCPGCGAAISFLAWLPPYRVELEVYGKEFGDFVFLGGSDGFLISQKFREVYYQYGLTGLVSFDPIEVIKVRNNTRRKLTSQPPKYFRVLQKYGPTAVDMEASGFEWITPPECSICRSGNKKRWKRVVLEPCTWTGEDIFGPRGLGVTLVSQRFKDACEQHGIKNAVFIPIEQAGYDFYPNENKNEASGQD